MSHGGSLYGFTILLVTLLVLDSCTDKPACVASLIKHYGAMMPYEKPNADEAIDDALLGAMEGRCRG